MNEPIKLVTKDLAKSITVRDKLEEALAVSREAEFIGIALIMLREDGYAYIISKGNGTRLQMLGAITDLQYSLSKDGNL